MFPLIKSRSTIDSRLDGKVVTGSEKQYCSILTDEEEESVVRFVRNKNRCLQGINKRELITYLDRAVIEYPVVLTSDGHSSRFDFEILKFCNEKKICLFISPPDTTGVTQLLDQCNKNIHL